ncbi:putative N-acyltransferase [Peptoniphilus sp. ING2-D1G]|nr:putative N-acyltransferase [Peptoniphilus sp. ING2-D1G]
MELFIKKMKDFNAFELHELYKMRVDVFVVEQQCPYREIDEIDEEAYHIYFKDDGEIKAYLRLFEDAEIKNRYHIGRVISMQRRKGFASRLLQRSIEFTKDDLKGESIELEAQTYARTLYEKVGFKQISSPFFEDGIEHIKMELELK